MSVNPQVTVKSSLNQKMLMDFCKFFLWLHTVSIVFGKKNCILTDAITWGHSRLQMSNEVKMNILKKTKKSAYLFIYFCAKLVPIHEEIKFKRIFFFCG